MNHGFNAPWHAASFTRFLSTSLPELLASRLPLGGFAAEQSSGSPPETAPTCRVTIEVAENGRTVAVVYPNLPAPDETGLFWLDGSPHIVVPVASQEELDRASVACVGEQLYDHTAARLGQAPSGLSWDENLVRTFLPLEDWFLDFLRSVAQPLDATNWHSRLTHLRRLLIPGRKRVVAPGQQGRVDPFETPEGPNIGRVFTVALGAEITDGRLVIRDHQPAAGLGHNAALIPFLEHDDPNRLLMGVNMMRQALVPPEAEPALVQTGLEPGDAGPDLWCGRNLLTAFIPWGEGCVEDGLIISESCAQLRLNYPYPAEPGDKIANRHGTKGVISQVLPDSQMPHLADGTPVEMIFSSSGLHTRGNFGQVREAVMGRIARAEGHPVVVTPFQSPEETQIRARLENAGLPKCGMERLRAGKDGQELQYNSTVGWVYWYRLVHLAKLKMRPVEIGTSEKRGDGQIIRDLEVHALHHAGALHTALESLTTRAASMPVNESFTSPFLARLATRLSAAGIQLSLAEERLSFAFTEPEGETLRLAHPMPHPWLPGQTLRMVGAPPDFADPVAWRAFEELNEFNEQLGRRTATRLPERLVEEARMRLEAGLNAYIQTLLPPDALRVFERQQFSGRAVISPGTGLQIDQVGLPFSLARALFGEMAEKAGQTLEEVMDGAWVIIHRAPAVTPTALLAFHPLLVPDPAIRLHPLATQLLNTDFDGDQVAVYLPLSQITQEEAGRRLSIAGHLERQPDLIDALLPPHEGLWGLASLSLESDGRHQITTILQTNEDRFSRPLTRIELKDALRDLLARIGIDKALEAAVALANLGYAEASGSGASLDPFAHSQAALPPAPTDANPDEWEVYAAVCAETILTGQDYRADNLGPQLLSASLPVRPATRRLLPVLVGPRGPVTTVDNQTVIIRRSLVQGRTAEELYASVVGARLGLARLAEESERILQESPSGEAYTVLARARRSPRPGIVFAGAAARGEIDPLKDEESRLLAGLAPLV